MPDQHSKARGRVTGSIQIVERARGPVFYLRYRTVDGRQSRKLLGPAWLKPKRSTSRDQAIEAARVRLNGGEAARKGVEWVARDGRCEVGYVTRKQAEAELRNLLADLDRQEVTKRSGATFTEAAAEFLRYVSEVRQIGTKTASDYRGVIDGYLLDEFGADTPIEDITPDGIESYRDRLMREGKLSNRSVVRHLTVLHGIFKRAKRAFNLAENPASADLVERPRVVYSGEFDTLDRDEVELLASVAKDRQDGAVYQVAAYTGLRQGELLALRWEDVDFVGGLLHVRRNFTGGEEKVPKGKRVRSVPMMPTVIDTLAALKDRDHFTEGTDLVFCSEVGGNLDHFKLRERFYAALKAAGLRRIRFHDLRHAFGTAAITKLDPYAVQSYMGHQHYSTTQRYLHHKPRREDAAALAEAFGSEQGTPGREGAESKA